MKNLILSLSLALFTFSTINANPTNNLVKGEKTKMTSFSNNVNTFCKLIQMGNYEAVKALIKAG